MLHCTNAACSTRTYDVQRLSAVRQIQLVQAAPQLLNLLGVDHDVARLTLHAAVFRLKLSPSVSATAVSPAAVFIAPGG